MDLKYNIFINLYSIIFLLVICLYSAKHNEKESLQDKLYAMMLQITIVMLIVDICGRFNGNPGTVYDFINHWGNFLIFLLSPILPSLWLLFAHDQVFQEERKTKRLIYPLIAVNVINAVLVILTQFFGWFYYIDAGNIYHRGPLFLLSASFTIALVLVAFFLIIANRKKIARKHYFALAFFAIPPSVCILLQIIYYGISLMLSGVVLSLLIVFLNIQNRDMYTDYLTGINNRKKFEIYLKQKINRSTVDKTFSTIMIDFNDFKSINDNFGHDMGDNALQISAKLLNSCLEPNDFIARFGGDEFCIILDKSDKLALEEIIGKIRSCIQNYNESGGQPYKLDFSMGYAIYDYNSHMNVKEYQKHIDVLLYQNKQANK